MKLFWVTTAGIALLFVFLPLEGEGSGFLKFLLVLTSPFATLTLVGILAFLGIIWETFSPLFKWIKSWFLR
jgi:hypothetical protein